MSKAFPPKQKVLFVAEDVLVVHPSRAIDLARIIRRMIIDVHRAGLSAQGQAEKTLLLHRYLTSQEFRQGFDAVVETSRSLKDLLRKERDGHHKIWTKRERSYNELGDNLAAIDQRVRDIIERPTMGKRAKLVRLAAS